jgi:hypothetical protein
LKWGKASLSAGADQADRAHPGPQRGSDEFDTGSSAELKLRLVRAHATRSTANQNESLDIQHSLL